MLKKKYNLVIDASRNRSGGSVQYIKNFIKYLKLENSKINKVVIFSYKELLKKIPKKSFLSKKTHSFLEMNIFFQVIWQFFFLRTFLKKNKCNILFTTDSASFCRYNPNIIFNQDILGFDKDYLNKTYFSFEKLRLIFIKFIQIIAMNNANKIIFLSKFSHRIISKFLKKKDYKIIPHGIEKKIIKLGKNNLKKVFRDYGLKKKIKIVYVSPLFRYKNHITVIKAYTRLKNKYHNLEIKFVGAYKHDLNYYNYILNKNPLIDKTCFTGELNREDVIKILKKSDIFVFASSCEAFGITLLEAMAMAMPIICSNKSGLPEILKNGGIYFNPDNDYQLACQIEKFIKYKNLRKLKSKIAFNLSLKYQWQYNVKKFLNLINEF